MGIEISVMVHGAQIGRALADDPEELAYALNELQEYDANELGREVADLAPYGRADEIAAWLTKVATAICEHEGDTA